MSTVVTPELFASITCSDLGLPSEMEPAISHKIRELIFRSMIHMIEDPTSPEVTACTFKMLLKCFQNDYDYKIILLFSILFTTT